MRAFQLAMCVAAVFAIAGCATSSVLDADAKDVPADRLHAFQTQSLDRSVRITITRDSGYLGAACNLGVKIDGKLAAGIGASEQAKFFVDPGTHSIVLTAYGHGICRNFSDKGLETTVSVGRDRRYRISTDNSGANISPD